ncbi:SapC family protein [Catenovulum sediminis]|uniref:SapC family protein n=1 Tax=Catenovulum sediminis TaxID=1740262 RepID=A0ABV1RIJ2_9ALTE
MSQPKVELLDKVRHKNVKLDTSTMDIPENHVNASFVVVNELSNLVHEYPIFITKNPTTGQFQLTAILGLKSGINLYLSGKEWRAKYLPLEILRRPFSAMMEKEDLSAGRIALDLNHPMVNESEGQSIFTETGDATPFLERIQNTFAQLMSGSKRTEAILNLAAEHNLIHAINLTIDLANGEKTAINGLYAVDTEALNKLTGEALEACHKAGVLEVCHLLLSSGAHIEKLIQWHDESQK